MGRIFFYSFVFIISLQIVSAILFWTTISESSLQLLNASFTWLSIDVPSDFSMRSVNISTSSYLLFFLLFEKDENWIYLNSFCKQTKILVEVFVCFFHMLEVVFELFEIIRFSNQIQRLDQFSQAVSEFFIEDFLFVRGNLGHFLFDQKLIFISFQFSNLKKKKIYFQIIIILFDFFL